MRLSKQWIQAILLICLIVPFLSGCWDRIEIEDRAIVLGISVDKASNSKQENEDEVTHLHGKNPIHDEDMLQLALQIALPGRIPLGPSEGGAGGGNPQQTVWVLRSQGHTIAEAMANLQQQISSRLFFGHLRIVVVSDAVAQAGIERVNLFLRRNAEVRTTTWVVVSKGKAEALMKAAPKLERVPTLYLLATLEEGVKMGKLPVDFAAAFWARSTKKGQEGYLPYIEMEQGENVNVTGIAYFKNEQMVGTMKPYELIALMSMQGVNPSGYDAVVHVPDTNGTVTIRSTKRKSRIKSEIKDGVPTFSVHLHIELAIKEKSSKEIVINQETIKKIEEAQRKMLIETSEKFLQQTQQQKADIVGFGEHIRANERKYWDDQIKTKEKWQEMYPDIKVDLQATMKIRRVGMTAW